MAGTALVLCVRVLVSTRLGSMTMTCARHTAVPLVVLPRCCDRESVDVPNTPHTSGNDMRSAVLAVTYAKGATRHRVGTHQPTPSSWITRSGADEWVEPSQ